MIYEVLNAGSENAVSNRELSERFGISERTIRKHVYNERRAGLPILSGMNGYYLPSRDPEEARNEAMAFLRKQDKAGRTQRGTAAAIGRAMAAQIGGAV